MKRKDVLVTGEVYHVFSRSIAGYKVFNDDDDFTRMLQLLKYYQIKNDLRFSDFIETGLVQQEGFNNAFNIISKDKNKLVQIVAYCFMPTHIHLILKQLAEKGISTYMGNILNSYSRYFNTLHKRKGPLWESKFKNVRVANDDQLLHLTRYIHLNPTTASLSKKPEDWDYSSYNEYLSRGNKIHPISQFNDVIEIKSPVYRKFVNDQISYQKELAKIKKLLLD